MLAAAVISDLLPCYKRRATDGKPQDSSPSCPDTEPEQTTQHSVPLSKKAQAHPEQYCCLVPNTRPPSFMTVLQDSAVEVAIDIGTPRQRSSAASSAWKAAHRKCSGERSATGTDSTSRPQRRSCASRSRVAPVGQASPVSGSVVKWCGPSTSTARRPPCHSSNASTTRVPSPTVAPACKSPQQWSRALLPGARHRHNPSNQVSTGAAA